jgi:GTP-binding protein EngB required for normal cell division
MNLEKPVSTLNEAQQRSLRIACEHMDSLLNRVEEVLHASGSNSVFPKYVNDISPVQRKTIEDYIARIRAQLLRVLAGQGIGPEPPRITATHAIHTTLTFVQIAIEELGPGKMRGYGPISEAGIADLNGVMQELESIVQQAHRYVLQGQLPELKARLSALENGAAGIELLRTIEDIVSRRGLVEYRSTIAMLVERLEERSFEIAIFGRVSSGKSSLLNHIVGADILPVGVTPVTAIPTRVAYGKEPAVQIRIEGLGSTSVEIEKLAEFVDERLNPGNQKRVARLIVRYPSDRLREGIVLVDTPGLGSLATSGAQETMAYLPRCDVGVVLIDAGSTLTLEDLKIVQALSNASIPVVVVLSKADLLSSVDRERVREYIRDHIRSELSLAVDVRPVSIVSHAVHMLDAWFNNDLASLYAAQQQLHRESIHRKIVALRDAVLAALSLESRSAHEREQSSPETPRISDDRLLAVESRLRRASGSLQSVRPELRGLLDHVPELGPSILTKAGDVASEQWANGAQPDLGQILWKVASATMIEVAGEVRDSIDRAVVVLRQELVHAASAIGATDMPTGEDLLTDREMPVFHMNRETLEERKPKLASLFGRSALARQAILEMEEFRPALDVALSSYASLLRGWTDSSLRHIEDQFNVFADRYRAQLNRALGTTSSQHIDLQSLHDDIGSLLSISSGNPAEVKAS